MHWREFMAREDGFAFLPFLGGLAKTAIGGLVGGAIKRRNDKKAYQQQRALGFTHSEIAGGGGMGMGASGMDVVMGNQQTQFEAQERQQEYDATQRALDREAGILRQDMASQATLGAASMAAEAQFNTAATQFDIAAMNNDRQWQQMSNDWANNNPDLNIRLKQLSMGVDNMVVELIMQRNGLNLTGNQGLSQAEFNRRMSNVMSEMAATQGWSDILREGARQGIAETNDILDMIQDGAAPPPSMGNGQYQAPAMPNLGRGLTPVPFEGTANSSGHR